MCHYWYFLDEWFKCELYVGNGCHNVLMMSINLNDIAILNIHGVDYCCNVKRIDQSKVINLLHNRDVDEKKMSIVKVKTIIIAHKMDAKIIITFSDIETEKKN